MAEEKKEEKIYYNSGGVLVSESKTIMSGKPYYIADIQSVSIAISVKRMRESFILGGIGILILIIGLITDVSILWILSIALIGLGIFHLIWAYVKPEYYVKINTPQGNIYPYSSDDKSFIDEIIDAINEAIAETQNINTEFSDETE
ncbi:hypothetical protein DRQ33_06250 [bacterium]|nr:MAG: hypothetical protein DRQ33_06250 [bacterium]